MKHRSWNTALWILGIIAIWEICAQAGVINTGILPSFSTIMVRIFTELQGALTLQVLNSLWIVLLGFCVSIVASVVVTVLCTWSSAVESLFQSLSTIMNPLPGIAILPVIMLWFGIGEGAMLVLIVHGVLWPLVTNMITGSRSCPAIYRDFAKNIGLSPVRFVFDVLIFAVMPYFISGLRIGWGRAWRALISAEMVFGMIGSIGGLGYYIYMNRAFGNMTSVMAGVLLIIIIGVLMEQLFKLIERKTVVKWGMSSEQP